MFNTLNSDSEGGKRRGAAFGCGLLIQVLLIGAAAFAGILVPKELPLTSKYYALVWLPEATPPKPGVKPPRPLTKAYIPPPEPLKAPELLAPPVARIEVSRIQPPAPPEPVRVAAPAVPPLPMPRPSPPPKQEVAVHTGLFGGGAEHVTRKRPVEEVQTGGFGNPQGLPGRAEGGNPGNVPRLGSFELPEGPGYGNGTGGMHGVPGVVASAGFGSGIAGAGYVRRESDDREPRVSTGGFEKARQVAQSPVSNSQAPPPAAFQPVEIISKPFPVYTEEARRLGIQGEVALSVVFLADGAIRVMAVVKSLGHGLDEAAQQAAAKIRFKPALRAGQPADFPATLRIQFRLADQST